jgi:hypothetical protein
MLQPFLLELDERASGRFFESRSRRLPLEHGSLTQLRDSASYVYHQPNCTRSVNTAAIPVPELATCEKRRP